MAMSKGNFILSCDEDDCENAVDLKTRDFDDAVQRKRLMQGAGWTYKQRMGEHYDYCPEHSE